MKMLYNDAQTIIKGAIDANMPELAVRNIVKKHKFSPDGDVYVVAIGKAAWTMANAAYCALGYKIKKGIVITKYDHSKGEIPNMEIIEAGHPVSDENTLIGTQKALDLVKGLKSRDDVLLLISGGGSALFEKPLDGISLEDIIDINKQLLACGADIVEMNMIRKRLSAVKGGRFAQACMPAKVFTVVLSDVLGDRIDSIASGPAVADSSTALDALNVIKKYDLKINDNLKKHIETETPKELENVESAIIGSVRIFCESAAEIAAGLGYTPLILCSEMKCEARQAGSLIASIAKQAGKGKYSVNRPCAIIFGGETVVNVKGNGKGGRNQELALSAAEAIEGMNNVIVFSFGSDGTDGPTDAAGAIVDGMTAKKLRDKKLKISDILDNNDSYNALKKINGLITTGPTGTNVNDISVILVE
jgi:hydroxypyruvate reductase